MTLSNREKQEMLSDGKDSLRKASFNRLRELSDQKLMTLDQYCAFLTEAFQINDKCNKYVPLSTAGYKL